MRSPIGQAVGGWLKSAAKSALPLAGGALGGLVGGPLGAKIGSGLASAAGSAFGLEAEMSQEDREFEGAKNFVKMAADTVKSAVSAPPIERFLAEGRRELKDRIRAFLSWLHDEGRRASPQDLQRRFVFLKLRFNAVLSQLELFHQVISQRSENEQGVWLSGLDVVAADALALPDYYEAPPVICYLDRGIGGAIRRARTRLPGGGENPVAVIRIPRERMIGSGIASSLVHEVGHQGAALLGLVPSLRLALRAKQQHVRELSAWRLWERWISEIVSDFWSIARVGVVSTLGLIGVVSLPRPFVFRINVDDPHPDLSSRRILALAISQCPIRHRGPPSKRLPRIISEENVSKCEVDHIRDELIGRQ